jgi:hypothetical protein
MIIQEKSKDFPVIYLRYLGKQLIYVGESSSFLKSRHLREDIQAGDFDTVKILKAPRNKDRRRYWEAWLVCKLKPIKQRQELYQYIVDRVNRREVKKVKNYDSMIEESKKLTNKELKYIAYSHLIKFQKFMAMTKRGL